LLRVGLVDQLSKVNALEKNRENKFHPMEVSNCFTGNFVSKVYDDGGVDIDNPLEIISPTKDDANWITKEPKMPSIICEAKLRRYYSEPIKYEWKYTVKYSYQRRTFKTHLLICSG